MSLVFPTLYVFAVCYAEEFLSQYSLKIVFKWLGEVCVCVWRGDKYKHVGFCLSLVAVSDGWRLAKLLFCVTLFPLLTLVVTASLLSAVPQTDPGRD